MTTLPRPNAWVTVHDQPTQLTYAARVHPSPLTVSIADRDPVLGSVEVLISNGTPDPLPVSSVRFAIVVGQPGPDGVPLTPSTAGMRASVSDTTNWALSGPPPAPPITSGTVTWTLGPKTGHSVSLAAGASVYVQIYGFHTVPDPSTSTIGVKEAIAGSDPQFTSIDVSTFPTGFYFDSLTATIPANGALVPVAQVGHAVPITLTWNSSVVYTENVSIYYSTPARGQQGPVTPSKLGEWLSPPLTDDTVFVVAVTATGAGGQSLGASLSTSVSVQNPDVVASSAVVGDGGVSVRGLLDAREVHATGVRATDVHASGVTIDGGLSATGAARIDGELSAGATNVTGPIHATQGIGADGPLTSGSGVSRLASVTVGGYLWLAFDPPPRTSQPALLVSSTSGTPACMFSSSTGTVINAWTGGQGPGVISHVAFGGIGLQTNGKIVSGSSQPLLTQLETSGGQRVVAPPLAFEPELHLSGRARLSGGRAVVELDAGAAQVIHHSEEHAYRVQITPTALCNGLAVTSKDASSFVVEELMDGHSDATFDWFLVAHAQESRDAPRPATLPDTLPELPPPPTPPEESATP